METFAVNLSGKVRHTTLDGRNYLVAPASMLVPGVLAGSKGPLYYPPDEVEESTPRWDRMPLTLGHPRDEAGSYIKANAPGVKERHELGFVTAPSYAGKLAGEAWFDVALTRKLAPDVLASLQAGKPVELSTGLFTTDERAPAGATHNGRPYEWIARAYVPDHLAVLVDAVGACSIRDGCGIGVNQADTIDLSLTDNAGEWITLENGQHVYISAAGDFQPDARSAGRDKAADKQLAKGQTPLRAGFAGVADEKSDKGTNALVTGAKWARSRKVDLEKHVRSSLSKGHTTEQFVARFKGASDTEKQIVAGFYRAMRERQKPTKNEAVAMNSDERRSLWRRLGELLGLVDAPTANALPDLTDRDLELGKVAATEKAAGHNPASWVVDEGIWEKAKAAADKGNYEGDTYWAVVAHIYEQMGGEVKGGANNEDTPTVNAMECPRCGAVIGQEDIADGEVECPECGWEGPEDDLVENQSVDKKALVGWLTTNCDCWKGQGDAETLNKLADDKLAALKKTAEEGKAAVAVANAAGKGFRRGGNGYRFDPARGKFVVNAAADDMPECDKESDAYDPEACDAAKAEEKPAANVTPAPAQSSLTPDQVADLAWARQERQRLKSALVDRVVTANAATPEAQAVIRPIYEAMDLPRLQTLAANLPAPERQPYEAPPSYLGAAGGVVNARDDSDNLLPTISYPWDEPEEAGAAASGKKA